MPALLPPIAPMLAKRVEKIPTGDYFLFEPKWDGFRALVFKDGSSVTLQSRDGKPLDRYFPELAPVLRKALPRQCVLDGEIVVAREGRLDFDALQMRLHPAASRVAKLSVELPTAMVFWDALQVGARDLRQKPFAERRAALEKALAKVRPPIHLTPITSDVSKAKDWFSRFEGAGLDGVMAKDARGHYEAGKRSMLKIKHERDCDCVIAGFRWQKGSHEEAIGSLLLGLYDERGTLQHVGVVASFTEMKRRELVKTLNPYRKGALAKHPWREGAVGANTTLETSNRVPGGKSRWSNGKDLSWEPVRPELVVEVAYDHMQSDRFRHTAQFRRFRPDKSPADCTYSQLEVVPPEELAQIFKS